MSLITAMVYRSQLFSVSIWYQDIGNNSAHTTYHHIPSGLYHSPDALIFFRECPRFFIFSRTLRNIFYVRFFLCQIVLYPPQENISYVYLYWENYLYPPKKFYAPVIFYTCPLVLFFLRTPTYILFSLRTSPTHFNFLIPVSPPVDFKWGLRYTKWYGLLWWWKCRKCYLTVILIDELQWWYLMHQLLLLTEVLKLLKNCHIPLFLQKGENTDHGSKVPLFWKPCHHKPMFLYDGGLLKACLSSK